jgi:hypothetical protein
MAVTGRTESYVRFASQADASVEDRIAQDEEHLHVVVNCVMISCGDELREQGPVAGRLLRVRTIRPIFGNHLLLVCQRCQRSGPCHPTK